MSEKIKPHHLGRKAILYVRQSSPQQVMRNEESSRLQYAMESRVRGLGWQQIEVVDEDLGLSATGSMARIGFERMVAEVCLGKAGAVAAREVSRFARNNRDWQQLVEVCRVVDTLLIDHETIYDPRRGNDRLLLGVKGTLNEYELDLLRLRSVEARREMARRGELIIIPPIGYMKTDDHRLVKDPDRRVQEALLLVFSKFLELGTARQTLMWFIEHGLELPIRRWGTTGWETVWRRPAYAMVLRVLRNPIYSGAYTYGKTEASTELRNGVACRTIKRKPREQWLSLIYDHHEGYINRDLFERVQEMISKNTQLFPGSGAPKKGSALLTGLLRCRRCGRKLMVRYGGRASDTIRYACHRGMLDNGDPRCISFGGGTVDGAISTEILRVVRPGAVEAAIQAGSEALSQHDEILRALRLDVEAARYTANRAWKQYDAADPENRLVASELENRWNAALERVQELEERIEQHEREREHIVPPAPRSFAELSEDLGQVWRAPETDVRLKKRIVRTLIDEVIVDTDDVAHEISLVIHWKGGVHTELRLRRRRRGQNSAQTSQDVIEAVRALTLICPDAQIAGWLNRNGLRTGRGNRWTKERVTSLRSKREIPIHSPERRKAEGWLTLKEAAAYVRLTPKTLRRTVERGEINAMHPLREGPWIFKRDDLDQPRAHEILSRVRQRHGNPAGQDPGQLTLGQSTT